MRMEETRERCTELQEEEIGTLDVSSSLAQPLGLIRRLYEICKLLVEPDLSRLSIQTTCPPL